MVFKLRKKWFDSEEIYLHKNQILSEGFNYTAFEVLASGSFPNLEQLVLADMDLND